MLKDIDITSQVVYDEDTKDIGLELHIFVFKDIYLS